MEEERRSFLGKVSCLATPNRRLFAIVFVASLCLRLFHLEFDSIWMDEDMQAGKSLDVAFDLSLIDQAAVQQQPPLDYYVQGICFKIFGATPFSARIHAVLFGSLAALVFSVMLTRISNRRWTVIFGSAAFVTNPWLIRYSQEGRPVACAVFFATLYLYLLITQVFADRDRRSWYRMLLLFVPVQLGFLLSIGFQPIVFLAVSCIVLIPLLFIREYRLQTAVHHAGFLIAMFAAFPVLLRTVEGGRHYLKDTNFFGMIDKFLSTAELPKLSSAIEKISSISGRTALLWGIVLLIGSIGIFLLRSMKRPDTAVRITTMYTGAFIGVFLVVFDILFFGLISYRIVIRYYMSLIPVFILFGTSLFDWSFALVASMRDDMHIPWKKTAAALLIGLVCVLSAVQLHETFKTVYYRHNNTGWRELYALFKENRDQSAHAYMMNLNRINRYHPYFFSQRFYYTEKPKPVLLHDSEKIPEHLSSESFLRDTKKVFLCTAYGFKKIKRNYFKSLTGVRVHRFTDLSVIEIIKHGNLRDQLSAVLFALKKGVGIGESSYKLFSILFKLKLQEGNEEAAARIIEDMKKMDARKKLSKRIHSFEDKLKHLYKKRKFEYRLINERMENVISTGKQSL